MKYRHIFVFLNLGAFCVGCCCILVFAQPLIRQLEMSRSHEEDLQRENAALQEVLLVILFIFYF